MEKNKKYGFKHFISKYDNKLRNLLRVIYLYGCYHKEDTDKLDIYYREYENNIRRLRFFINYDELKDIRVGKKLYNYFSYDMFDNTENCLVDTYRLKAFSKNDINMFFLIQQLLNEHREGLSHRDILDKYFSECGVYADDKTLILKLKDMIEYGYLKKEGRLYKIKDDFLAEFNNDEIISIFNYVEFYKNAALAFTPYYFLVDTLNMYLKYERNCPYTYGDIFVFKHLSFVRTMEDDVIYKIIQAMSEKKMLNILYEDENLKVIPLNIVTEYYYGRHYLLGIYDMENMKAKMFRMDKIDKIGIFGSYNIEDDVMDKFKSVIHNAWCVSIVNNTGVESEDNKPVEVVADFVFSDKDKYLISRFFSEKNNGSIKQISKNHYVYKISVTDPNEMIPWLRSYAGVAVVRKSKYHDLYEKLNDNCKEALQRYGVI